MSKGVKILQQSLAEGPRAEKGMRLKYSARIFLNRGDEVTQDFESIKRYGNRIPTRTVEGTDLIEHATVLGSRQSIAGVEAALAGLTPGSFREVLIPPHLGYGAKGLGDIVPPNALLRVKVWLHEICGD